MNDLRALPFYRVLYRPNLLLGADRDLVALVLLCSAALAFTAMNLVAGAGALVLWLIAIRLLRALAKQDPLIHKLYLQQLPYQSYYPPRSTPFVREK